VFVSIKKPGPQKKCVCFNKKRNHHKKPGHHSPPGKPGHHSPPGKPKPHPDSASTPAGSSSQRPGGQGNQGECKTVLCNFISSVKKHK